MRWPWGDKEKPKPPVQRQPPITPTTPKPLSQQTVALMISIFDRLFHQPGAYRAAGPPLDIAKLRNLLFAMGLKREVLDTCEYTYNWYFQSLLPAIHDGSFFSRMGIFAASGREHGQATLRAFATALCGILSQYPELRSSESTYFEHCLNEDGFQFIGNRLVETTQDIIPEAQEISAVESLIRSSVHGSKELLLYHFGTGRQLFDAGQYHPAVSEWRSFFEEALRGVWRLTRANRPDFKSYAETPNMKDLFAFLLKAGFLNSDEQLAFSSTWAFLCSGGHPGISDRDDAHLSMLLALSLGHAALLKLQSWSSGGFTHF